MTENTFNKFFKTDKKLIWPVLVKRFFDDGFRITKRNKLDFESWISKFSLLLDSLIIDKFKYGNGVDFIRYILMLCIMVWPGVVSSMIHASEEMYRG